MKTTEFISGFLVVAAAIGCQSNRDGERRDMAARNPNRDIIEAKLTALLQHRNEEGFVIFEEKHSRKFVQFGRDLSLDLPFQSLDHGEAGRAEQYFREHGVSPVEYDVFDRPGGKVVGRQRAFQKTYGQDVRAATVAALDIFERVYQFPADFALVVTEN